MYGIRPFSLSFFLSFFLSFPSLFPLFFPLFLSSPSLSDQLESSHYVCFRHMVPHRRPKCSEWLIARTFCSAAWESNSSKRGKVWGRMCVCVCVCVCVWREWLHERVNERACVYVRDPMGIRRRGLHAQNESSPRAMQSLTESYGHEAQRRTRIYVMDPFFLLPIIVQMKCEHSLQPLFVNSLLLSLFSRPHLWVAKSNRHSFIGLFDALRHIILLSSIINRIRISIARI